MVTAHNTNKMDLDRVQEWSSDHEEYWDDEAEENDALNAFGEKCHNCGGVGHYARECPSRTKGKGKGKDGKGKGAPKGGGKGKGPQNAPAGSKGKGKAAAPQFGTCWTCGGAHFARNCPHEKGSSKGGANTVQVHHLCSAIEMKNRFKLLEKEEEEEE